MGIQRYFNEHEVAEITGRAVQTYRNERHRGIGMPYIKIGRSVRYKLDDVLSFMEAHRVETEDSLIIRRSD
ncbi:helix-turn-helix domain-containing protein [candidate division KSB1 bacterium]|nr:helix-turn-helix domain-containing protein [candidate division KSB1 bacterium]